MRYILWGVLGVGILMALLFMLDVWLLERRFNQRIDEWQRPKWKDQEHV
jgi:hypothetical protein